MQKIINRMDDKARVYETEGYKSFFEVVAHTRKGLQKLKIFEHFQDAHNFCLVYNRGKG